jgi:dihydrofolate reductase/thymidylate synthase
MRKFNIIASVTKNGGIGYNNSLAIELSKDMRYFKKITTQGGYNAIIMGKNTFESIGKNPLPNRLNIVITRDENIKNIITFKNLNTALDVLGKMSNINDIYVIGGEQIYEEAIKHPYCNIIYLTRIDKEVECDRFFDKKNILEKNYQLIDSHIDTDNDINMEFCVYKNKIENINIEELQYLSLIRTILEKGINKHDRTNVGTVSIFGTSMKFNLRDNTIPVLTTKRVFWKGIVEELLWFIAGSTDSKILENKGINIWKGNTSKDFLDKMQLNYEEGDIGPMYGFQWRHFGAKYIDKNTNYNGIGVDQLKNCIEMLKNDKNSRRIVMSSWNPTDLDKMVLNPCHVMCQFYVENNELHSSMYQRSGDIGLGIPFNIASYSLVTHMIAQVVGLKPGSFTIFIGDTHIYNTHIEPLKIQLERVPREFPKIFLNKNITDIDNFTYDDIKLQGYNPYPKINMEMAV